MDSKEFENIKKKLGLNNQGVSDVMGIRLQTVKNWSGGVWLIPNMADKFLRVLKGIKDGKIGSDRPK